MALCTSPGHSRGWKRWLSWAMRCRLAPIKVAANIIKPHLWGIVNAIILKVSNGPAESINRRINPLKCVAEVSEIDNGLQTPFTSISEDLIYISSEHPQGVRDDFTHSFRGRVQKSSGFFVGAENLRLVCVCLASKCMPSSGSWP